MNLIYSVLIFFTFLNAYSSEEWSIESIELSHVEKILADNIVNIILQTKKNQLNQNLLHGVIGETERSKNFSLFHPWLKEILAISKTTSSPLLLKYCKQYAETKESIPLERYLENIAGNYCRDRALESIARETKLKKTISEESLQFITENLKHFLKSNKKLTFLGFIQTQMNEKENFKKLANEITSYNMKQAMIPTQEAIKDSEIKNKFSGLIQGEGFISLSNENVFYSEYGKLIHQGYKLIETKASEEVIVNHFNTLKSYFEKYQNHLPIDLCLSRLNDYTKNVHRSGNDELAKKIYQFILSAKPSKEILEDTLFFYLWIFLSKNEFKEAYKIAQNQNLLQNAETIQDSRLKFWIAKIFEKLDYKKKAIPLLENIVLNHPLSFYAIMASKKLQDLDSSSEAGSFYSKNLINSLNHESLNLKNLDTDYFSALVRLKAWSSLHVSKLIKVELKRIKNHNMPTFLVKNPTDKQLHLRSELHLLHAKIIEKSQNYLSAFRYLYEALDDKEIVFNKKFLEMLYPHPFFDIVTNKVSKNFLDPIVVISLIRQESVFNPEARSRVGARGLMQLMPTTARQFKRSISEKQLANPDTNIEIGTQYLSNLMKRYDGNLVYVLAAYNAGEARVDRWRNQYFDSEETILKNIESIPFLETRNYVKLIFRNIFFYKILLDNQNKIADSKEINKIFDIHLGFKN